LKEPPQWYSGASPVFRGHVFALSMGHLCGDGSDLRLGPEDGDVGPKRVGRRLKLLRWILRRRERRRLVDLDR